VTSPTGFLAPVPRPGVFTRSGARSSRLLIHRFVDWAAALPLGTASAYLGPAHPATRPTRPGAGAVARRDGIGTA